MRTHQKVESEILLAGKFENIQKVLRSIDNEQVKLVNE